MTTHTINLDNYSSVNQTQAHERTSSKYAFVPTRTMLDILADYGWHPTKVLEARTRQGSNNRGFQCHVVRLRQHNAPLVVGDSVPELVLKKSHLGNSSFQLMAGIFRLVCSNGMVVGENYSEQKIRHVGFAPSLAESAIKEVCNTLPAMIESVEGFKGTRLLDYQREAFAKAAIELIADEDNKYTIQPRHILTPRRWNDRDDQTLWGSLNVVQENIIRGGIPRRAQDGSRRRTTAVKSPDKDLKLNRALWTLADTLKSHIDQANM